VISGWQESYLSNSNCSSVDCASGDILAPDPFGVVGHERGRPYQGASELFKADGRALGGTGARGVSARGTRGTEAMGTRYAGAIGTIGVDDAGTRWE
jgi:hypothetical protein